MRSAIDMLNLWAAHARFDDATRAEAASIKNNAEKTESAFGLELAFGTGGMRGIIGVGTNRMNIYTVARATQGLADYLLEKGGGAAVISCDSRHYSREFAEITGRVFAQNNITAHVFPRVMPTPVLSYAVRQLRADAGVMITASHNSSDYNGYKAYGADGCQFTDGASAEITEHIQKINYENLEWMPIEGARGSGLYRDVPDSLLDDFIAKTLSCRMPGAEAGQLRAVYTPLHGTGLEPLRRVFDMTGANVRIVERQAVPDGDFPTAPLPNPEFPAAWKVALEDAAQISADIAIATDPDCDRVGVAARDSGGEYRILTGNEIGLLLMDYLLSCRKEAGTLPKNAAVIKTIVTSDLAYPIAGSYGATVIDVLTGFKYIGEIISRMEAEGRTGDFILGFEESCGYLAGAHVRDKDGVMTAMLVLDMAEHHKRGGATLLSALEALYSRYGYEANGVINIAIESANPMARMGEIMARMRGEQLGALAGAAMESATDYIDGADGLPPSNVLAYRDIRGGKAIVRPSGTEPKLKIYLSARARDAQGARSRLSELEKEARGWCG